MRFFAALVIVIYHSFDFYYLVFDDKFPLLIKEHFKGYLAVDFFFILSGFILTHVYAAQVIERKISKRDFYLLRLSRIYPAHVVMLLFCLMCMLIYGSFGSSEQIFSEFLKNVLLIHAWDTVPHNLNFNPPSWSVSAEWFAYLLFPLLLYRMKSLDMARSAVFAVGAVVLIWVSVFEAKGVQLTELHDFIAILRVVPLFILGMFLYRLGVIYQFPFANFFIMPVMAITLLALSIFKIHDGFSIFLFCLLILAGAEQGRQKFPSFLSTPIMVYGGMISYSLYLVHWPLVKAVMSISLNLALSKPALQMIFIGLVPLSLGAAIVLYHAVEDPARKYVKMRLGRSKTR